MSKAIGDLFASQTSQKKDAHIFTVSQITQDIKLILENTFGEVWVEGEVSNFRAHDSGHLYFSLKDEGALLPAAIFNYQKKDFKFRVENGLKVVCFGKIDVYPPHGAYKLIIEKIEPKGIGSLQLALEQLKEKLEKEGLFSPGHKKPTPYLPAKIGVVTSLSGAAIKDILKVLERRFRDVHIIISPARVQGEEAKEEIAQAIKDFNRLNDTLPISERIEVLIVGRGGGSIEDLWAFNEEVVARAIYNSRIPIISAVGHERDWTIADLVADVRAATPSVAAELVIPKKEELKLRVDELSDDIKRSFLGISSGFEEAIGDLAQRMALCMQNSLRLSENKLVSTQNKLALLNPSLLIQQHKAKIVDFGRQIQVRIEHFVKLRQAEFNGAVEKLSSLSPLNILARGYSITFKMPQSEALKDIKSIKSGDTVKTKLHKGDFLSKVMEVNQNGGS